MEIKEPYKIEKPNFVIHKEEYGGTEQVLFQKCAINACIAYVVRSAKNEEERGEHPLTILEILSDIKLREKFALKDGDKITIDF